MIQRVDDQKKPKQKKYVPPFLREGAEEEVITGSRMGYPSIADELYDWLTTKDWTTEGLVCIDVRPSYVTFRLPDTITLSEGVCARLSLPEKARFVDFNVHDYKRRSPFLGSIYVREVMGNQSALSQQDNPAAPQLLANFLKNHHATYYQDPGTSKTIPEAFEELAALVKEGLTPARDRALEALKKLALHAARMDRHKFFQLEKSRLVNEYEDVGRKMQVMERIAEAMHAGDVAGKLKSLLTQIDWVTGYLKTFLRVEDDALSLIEAGEHLHDNLSVRGIH